ncbi:hypothetical protein AAVH_38206, partial [Aphelenchoides avenae]
MSLKWQESAALVVAVPFLLFHLSMVFFICRHRSRQPFLASTFFSLFVSTSICDIALFTTTAVVNVFVHVDWLVPFFLDFPALSYACYNVAGVAYFAQLIGHTLQALNRFDVFRATLRSEE